MKRLIAAALAIIGLSAIASATSVTMDGPMTDANAALGQAYPKNFTLNMDDRGVDVAALTMLYYSTTPAAATFTDGTASTFTITVAKITGISSATATAAVYISSNAGLVGQSLYLAGVNLPFNVGTVSSMTACDMAGQINTYTQFASTCAVNSATGIIYSTAPVYGASWNSFSVRSSSITAISSAAFSGGVDNAQVCINGSCLVANKHWFPKATAAATADSLYAAINSSFSIVTSTETGSLSIIYTTSTAVGAATTYVVTSSTQASLTISPYTSSNTITGLATGTMFGGANASFAIGSPIVTITNHNLASALGVYVSSASGTSKLFWSTAAVGGTQQEFRQGTTYYAIPLTANTLEFAETSTGAVAGLPIIFASSQTKTTTDTYQLNISTVSGAFSYGTWMGNDGTNYVQIGSTNSVSVYPVVSSTTFYDFGTVDYKWLQLRVVAPTSGAVSVNTSLHGKKR